MAFLADVSVILPVHNAEKWLDECLQSVFDQQLSGIALELSIYNDCSTDRSGEIIQRWKETFRDLDVEVVYSENSTSTAGGVGFAKNRAVEQSRGTYLCFLDADDVMRNDRIHKQYQAAVSRSNAIVGSGFSRIPENSTPRYTDWANSLSPTLLYSQTLTSHGPTLVMPTWFCHRSVFERVGGFSEAGKGTPEDLIFFYSHLDLSGELFKVDEPLVTYRYHPEATTFSILEETIWNLRLKRLEDKYLTPWRSFTIWSAGKQGRRLYRSLSESSREKVVAFCDVDKKKIEKGFYVYENSPKRVKPNIPIIHFSQAKAPIVVCVKINLHEGGFEDNLASLGLQEAVDFVHFG